LKAGFNRDEPRDERGRWANGDSSQPASSGEATVEAATATLHSPKVPEFPLGESLRHNVDLASLLPIENLIWKWRTGGEWDYARGFGSKYDDAGNFNYGATAAAAGWPEGLILRAGAAYHSLFGRRNTSNESNPFGQYPYGNTREKEAQILEGIRWYRIHGGEIGGPP